MGASSIVPVQYISTKQFNFIVPVLYRSTSIWFYVDLPSLSLCRQPHIQATHLAPVQVEIHSVVIVPGVHLQSVSQAH